VKVTVPFVEAGNTDDGICGHELPAVSVQPVLDEQRIA
jgi:hypothetical protein